MELRLENGDAIRASSPEFILRQDYLVAVDAEGDAVWVDTDAVTSIKPIRRRNGKS